MKIRALQKKLKTEYVIRNEDDNYLSIGSRYLPKLIYIPSNGTKVYKDEIWTIDGAADYHTELSRIYRLLEQMVETKEILEYLTGADTLDDPLPVYSVKDGCIIEGFTDKYGYPDITDRGFLMYENQFFSTPEAAIEKGIHDARASVDSAFERVLECAKALEDARSWLATKESHLISLELLAGGSNG